MQARGAQLGADGFVMTLARMAVMSKTKEVTPPFNWRDHLAVHPAADLFPLMSEAELKELAEDINKHGVRSDILLWRDANGDKSLYLLDGRNRLDAMALLGRLKSSLFLANSRFLSNVPFGFVNGDPYAIALSFNVHRRHLTAEQKRELIAKVLKANPDKSNRQIAKEVKASHPHVAKVRTELEKTGDVETVSTSIDTKGRKQPAKRKVAVSKSPKRDPEIIQGDDCATREQIWYRGLVYRAGEAAAGAAYSNWQREYGDWSQFKLTTELAALTDQVIESWQKLKAKLSELPQQSEAAA
jgi:DNA-binding Lrp family transcriptional regulator